MPDGLPEIYEGDAANGYTGFADNFATLIAPNDAINSYRLTFSKDSNGNLNSTDVSNELQALITKNIALAQSGSSLNLFSKCYFYFDDEPAASSYATVASNNQALVTVKNNLASQLNSYPTLKASFLAIPNIVTAAYPAIDSTSSSDIKKRVNLGVSTASSLLGQYYNESARYNYGINTWCPTYNNFDTAAHRSVYSTRQANGEHVWWYGCINPIQPYPTYHLNAPLLPSRMLSYMEDDYGIEGNLYWCASYFGYYNGSTSTTRDVWSNGNTWENCYGDGMIQITIDRLSDGQKAEKFVKKYLSDAPLGFIYKAFRKKDIKRNGHWIPKDAILHQGDELRIYVTDQQLADFKKPREAQKKPFPYQIVYEDSNVIIVNKPKGLLVYGDDKGVRATLGNAILDYLYFKGEYDPHNAAFTPSPAHRLDRNTSGLVVYGKTDAALKELTDLFKERTEIEKRYLALVVGKVEHGVGIEDGVDIAEADLHTGIPKEVVEIIVAAVDIDFAIGLAHKGCDGPLKLAVDIFDGFLGKRINPGSETRISGIEGISAVIANRRSHAMEGGVEAFHAAPGAPGSQHDQIALIAQGRKIGFAHRQKPRIIGEQSPVQIDGNQLLNLHQC